MENSEEGRFEMQNDLEQYPGFILLKTNPI